MREAVATGVANMGTKSSSETPPTPSEVSFAAFRKRVSGDKRLAESIKKSVADTPADGNLLAAITKTVRAINAS